MNKFSEVIKICAFDFEKFFQVSREWVKGPLDSLSSYSSFATRLVVRINNQKTPEVIISSVVKDRLSVGY